ncbi:MAG: O-antigen ligase family protein [Siculibacillus sp.]|nr:O-antigen ligase family protein [Siculibacillus sp.]
MTFAAAPTSALDRTVSVERLGDAVLFLTVLTSGIVMFEPAPYDVVLSIHAVVALALGLALPRAVFPAVVLLLLFNVGGILALTRVRWWEGADHGHPAIFVAISLMLALNAVFFAATCAEKPHRMALIMKATVAAAVIVAVIGLLGYGLKIEALMRAGRAKATFKDPNVFGPFLVVPLVYLARRILTERLSRVWTGHLWAIVILAGIFLSMSRAAWGLAAGCLALLGLVLYIDERTVKGRLRLIAVAAAALVGMAALLAVALSFPEVRDLFGERAKLVQSYDGARLGRFARHGIGFLMATELPLGLGPYQFGHIFPEDPHNVFLKSLMVYGWLGFISYAALSFWTLAKLFGPMFLPRPWKSMAQVVWVLLAGHLAVSWIIDSDHWRHFFLLWGLAWAIIALEARHRRSRKRRASTAMAVDRGVIAGDHEGEKRP